MKNQPSDLKAGSQYLEAREPSPCFPVLRVFNDDEGNLLIITNGIEATDIVSGYFTEVGV